MFKINDKVKCYNFLCQAIDMDKIYTVIGVQTGFDNKEFLHLKEAKQNIGFNSENFKKVL